MSFEHQQLLQVLDDLERDLRALTVWCKIGDQKLISKLGSPTVQTKEFFRIYRGLHNRTHSCTDTINQWRMKWSSQDFVNKIARNPRLKSQCLAQAFDFHLWMLFLPHFSLVEYTMKQVLWAIPQHPVAKSVNTLKSSPNRIRFTKMILIPSVKMKIITPEEEKEWKDFVQLRNTIVHNAWTFSKNMQPKILTFKHLSGLKLV
ncbi:MAG: hypothetical protein ACFFC7_34140, partial [Candidatus Hermodarchaeota archaeon]